MRHSLTQNAASGNAALMNIKEDLGFSGAQFSLAVSMFFVGTCVADLFTNIGMRYIRPSLYLSGAMVCLHFSLPVYLGILLLTASIHCVQVIWGIVASLQAVAGGPAGMYAIRFFLGVFEAVFISGAPYMTTILIPRAVSESNP